MPLPVPRLSVDSVVRKLRGIAFCVVKNVSAELQSFLIWNIERGRGRFILDKSPAKMAARAKYDPALKERNLRFKREHYRFSF